MYNPIKNFKNAMRKHGLTPSMEITPGKFIRFPGFDKSSNNTAGWCKLFPDYRGGVFGDFSTGLSEIWFNNGQNEFNQNFLEKIHSEIEKEKHRAASEYAITLYKTACPADPNHPYLQRKKCPGKELKQKGDDLVIPIQDAYGNLTSLQFIKPNGDKRFLKDGKKKGSFAFIGEETPIIYMCEGWATGETIHLATGKGVIVAMDANNLTAVAEAIKDKFLSSVILVCGDRDSTGVELALKSAKILNPKGDAILPNFKNYVTKPKDFNDLMISEGLEGVKKQIEEQTNAILKL